MSLKAKRKVVSSIPPMDGGTYMGVCVAVVDLGQQYKQFEKQKQGKYAEECMFIFEIPDERVEVDGEDKPRWLSSRRFTVSLHERAALFQMLTAWRGKALTDAELDPAGDGFDLMQMAGVPAMLSKYMTAMGSPLFKNNEARYYPFGEDAFEDLFEDLEQAEHFIFIEFFIVAEGAIWDQIHEILLRKIHEGVKVKFLYDDFGALFRTGKDFAANLRKEGFVPHSTASCRHRLFSLWRMARRRRLCVYIRAGISGTVRCK